MGRETDRQTDAELKKKQARQTSTRLTVAAEDRAASGDWGGEQ